MLRALIGRLIVGEDDLKDVHLQGRGCRRGIARETHFSANLVRIELRFAEK